MKLVKFKDGTFGIRKGFFPFYSFKDFDYPVGGKIIQHGYWRGLGSNFISNCRTTEEEARKVFSMLTDKGEVVE